MLIIIIFLLLAVFFLFIWLLNATEGSAFYFPVAYGVIFFLPVFFYHLLIVSCAVNFWFFWKLIAGNGMVKTAVDGEWPERERRQQHDRSGGNDEAWACGHHLARAVSSPARRPVQRDEGCLGVDRPATARRSLRPTIT